jgi:hypothetical protein
MVIDCLIVTTMPRAAVEALVHVAVSLWVVAVVGNESPTKTTAFSESVAEVVDSDAPREVDAPQEGLAGEDADGQPQGATATIDRSPAVAATVVPVEAEV